MKKRIVCIAAGVWLAAAVFSAPQVRAEPMSAPSVSASAAVLIHADTGSVLFEKDAESERPMASTTKIMTALLTLEAAEKDDRVVTITEEMVRVEGSSMGLKAGYSLPLSGLAKGMLLASGNDAANAAAIAVGGDVETFVGQMNARAKEIGMAQTCFVTPSGLDAEGHVSTALDMARLGACALQNEGFAAIVRERQLPVAFVNPELTTYYSNHNKLLRLYEGCIGIKTGFTKKAGRCLVSAAERDGVRLVAVTLNAPDDWNDHIRMFDYGFSLFSEQTLPGASFDADVVGGTAETVRLSSAAVRVPLTAEEAAAVETEIECPPFLYAPVSHGEQAGVVRYRIGDTVVAESPLTVSGHVGYAVPPEKTLWEKLWGAVTGFFKGG